MADAAVAEPTSSSASSTTDTSASGSAAATAQPSSAVAAPVKSDRPKSMRESFERLEKASEPPAANSATAATAQSAATQPAVTPDAAAHAEALKGFRDYRQKFGWAEKIKPAQLQEWGNLASRLTNDRVGFATDFLAELQQVDPASYNAIVARFGGQGRTAAQPAAAATTSLDPDVEIMDASGRVVGKTFSAERVQAILQKGIADVLGKEVQPLKQDLQTRQEQQKRDAVARVTAERTASIDKSADTIMTQIERILDGDKSLMPEVEKMWAQHPDWSAHDAALEVRDTIVKPRQKGQATQDAITEMTRKAAGNTSNGAGASAMPKRPTNPKELAQWMREREKPA